MNTANTETTGPSEHELSSGARCDSSAGGKSPAALAQPAANEYPFPKSDDEAGNAVLRDGQGATVTVQVIKGRFAEARDSVASRYRDALQSTDEFVRHNPWKNRLRDARRDYRGHARRTIGDGRAKDNAAPRRV